MSHRAPGHRGAHCHCHCARLPLLSGWITSDKSGDGKVAAAPAADRASALLISVDKSTRLGFLTGDPPFSTVISDTLVRI